MTIQTQGAEQAAVGWRTLAKAEIDQVTKGQRDQQNGGGSEAEQDKRQRNTCPIRP
jgi:hypothetical protein